MITPKIKALFQFIEFLHSNIDNFKQYDVVINDLYLLDDERQKVSSCKNFSDKLKYDKIQEQIEDKFKIIQENILQPIRAKAIELNICDMNKTETLWNWNSTEIHELKKNFSKKDLPEIFSYKSKYLDYRKKTKGESFFGLDLFFNGLDQLLKELFGFFKETEQNEFEAFENKAIQVNDIGEAVKLFAQGYKKFELPNSFLNPSTIQQQTNIEPLPPQPSLANSGYKGQMFTSHEVFYKALIFAANESEKHPINEVYEWLKKAWFFINSDQATFNGKEVEAWKRSLYVNPVIAGEGKGNKPVFDKFFNAKITYSATQNNIKIVEQDFINDLSSWIEKKSKDESEHTRKRKFNEFLAYIKTKALPPQPIVKQKPELKIDQIALKFAYEGLQITRGNGNEIAKEYGHNSGEKLFQRFTYFSSSANRKGKPNLCTPKKLDNKIKLIESIIELLPADKQARAKDEVLILKKIYEAEYQ